jgi:DNA polymerase-3 subunit epsilon
MNLHLKKPLAVFDLETTGVSISNDRIVEISILRVETDGAKRIKTQRLNPQIPISPEASLVHGISDEDVADCPTFRQVAKDLHKFLEGCDLAGFNHIKFDIPILTEEFLRVGINFDIENRLFLDAQRIFHMMEPRSLEAAYKFYCDKDLQNAHSAEADTLATWEVLDAQIGKYKGKIIPGKKEEIAFPESNREIHELYTQNMVDLAGRMIYNKDQEPVFAFGKHRGKKVVDVLKKEPAYYDWIINSDFPLNTKQRLTELKLKMR